MTAYKMPDALGGGDLELLTDQNPTRLVNEFVWVRHEVLGLVQVDRNKLIVPLPPEPADGSYVLVGRPNGYPYMFHRDVMQAGIDGSGPQWTWWWHDNGEWVGWKDVCSHGTPMRLMRDPAADAPALPWVNDNHGDHGFVVERDPFAGEALKVNGRILSASAQCQLLAILARQLKPGAERDALFAAAEAGAR